MAVRDERNQDEVDATEGNDDRTKNGIVDEVALAETEADETDDEDEESEGNDPILP